MKKYSFGETRGEIESYQRSKVTREKNVCIHDKDGLLPMCDTTQKMVCKKVGDKVLCHIECYRCGKILKVYAD